MDINSEYAAGHPATYLALPLLSMLKAASHTTRSMTFSFLSPYNDSMPCLIPPPTCTPPDNKLRHSTAAWERPACYCCQHQGKAGRHLQQRLEQQLLTCRQSPHLLAQAACSAGWPPRKTKVTTVTVFHGKINCYVCRRGICCLCGMLAVASSLHR